MGARDSLRLEAGLCLHGNDIDTSRTPSEAMLMWTVRKIPEADFIGSEYLKANKKTNQKRAGYLSEGKGIIRTGSIIMD